MEPLYRLANGLGRVALRAMSIETRWSGAEHIPADGPVILAATHVSYPDFVFIERAAITRGRRVRFMCRADIWQPGLLSWAMDRMQHIPVDREVPAYAYLRARRLLEQSEAVGGFPEAGISYSFTVRPLMRGLPSLARETGAPIVPVGVWGSQRIFTVGDPEPPPDFTRRRRVDVAFGAPMYLAPGDDLTEFTHRLGHRLTELLEDLQRQPHHQPRPGEVAHWHPAHLGGHALTRAQARTLDVVPRSAVRPSWGPDLAAYADLDAAAQPRSDRSAG